MTYVAGRAGRPRVCGDSSCRPGRRASGPQGCRPAPGVPLITPATFIGKVGEIPSPVFCRGAVSSREKGVGRRVRATKKPLLSSTVTLAGPRGPARRSLRRPPCSRTCVGIRAARGRTRRGRCRGSDLAWLWAQLHAIENLGVVGLVASCE